MTQASIDKLINNINIAKRKNSEYLCLVPEKVDSFCLNITFLIFMVLVSNYIRLKDAVPCSMKGAVPASFKLSLFSIFLLVYDKLLPAFLNLMTSVAAYNYKDKQLLLQP